MAAVATAALSLVSCEEKKVPDPLFTLMSCDEISVAAEGGEYSIEYNVEYPAANGRVLVATEQSDWITGINTDVPDVVSFVVTANDTQQEREGSVVLSYEYHKEGTPAMDLSVAVLEVTVLQEAGQAGQKPDPNPDYSDAFTVEVSEITATSARIAASCKYPELYWTVDVIGKNDYDFYIAGNEYEMQSYFTNYLLDVALSYGYTSLRDFLPEYLFAGDYEYNEVMENLMLETEYIPFSIGMDFNAGFTTGFYFGDSFSTAELPKSDLAFEFKLDVRETSVTMDVYPSDKEAYYYATIIDSSYFGAGFSDEYIMNDLLRSYGDDLIHYLYRGDLIGEESTGMIPTTYYYAIAFGVDAENGYYNTELFKQEFQTVQAIVSDAYAEGSMDNYWLIEDLVKYNPSYEGLIGSEDLFGALDIEFNDSAVSAVCVVYVGDLSDVDMDELYRSALVQGTPVGRDDPARLVYMSYNDPCTICVIAKDADGYNGEMSLTVVNLAEEGTSHDYGLFDEYYNAYMGGANGMDGVLVAKKAL